MSVDQFLGELWGFLSMVGPIALAIYGVFALIVFSLVVFVFVKVFKSMSKMDKDFDRKWRR